LKKHVKAAHLFHFGLGATLKLHKMSGRKNRESPSYILAEGTISFSWPGLTFEERVSELGLNPRRADVYIPATKNFLVSSAKWIGAKKIHVQIGLSEWN